MTNLSPTNKRKNTSLIKKLMCSNVKQRKTPKAYAETRFIRHSKHAKPINSHIPINECIQFEQSLSKLNTSHDTKT